MVKCVSPSFGGCQIEFLLVHLEFYTIFIILRYLVLVAIYLVCRLHCALQNVRSSIEKEVCCACSKRNNHQCREIEVLESDRYFLKARYDVISVRLMSLKELAHNYRKELKRLRDSRFESERMYLEVFKGIEESWIAELEQKHKEYTKLLKTRSFLECEANDLKNTFFPELDLSDGLLEDSELDYSLDTSGVSDDILATRTSEEDKESLVSTASSETTDDFEYHDNDIADFKMKACFFVQQSLLCGSSPASMLISLEIAALTPDFCRKKCILGTVLGTLKYLESTNSLHRFSSISDAFSKLNLLFAHFTEKFPDQFAILDEVLNFCSKSSHKLSACPLVVAAMCSVGVVDIFASSKWFKNCTDITVLSHSVELLNWIHSEQHGSYCILQTAPSRPEKPCPEEVSLLESCPLAPYLQDLRSLGSDPSLYISGCLDSCVFLNGEIPFPPPGAFLLRQDHSDESFSDGSLVENNQKNDGNTTPRENICSMELENSQLRPRARKTVSFDTATHIIS